MKQKIFFMLVVILALVGCADSTNVDACVNINEAPYGFWSGTWHGMITWFSFVGSLIYDDVAIYAVNNNGAWYDFGFLGGLWVLIKVFGLIIGGNTK